MPETVLHRTVSSTVSVIPGNLRTGDKHHVIFVCDMQFGSKTKQYQTARAYIILHHYLKQLWHSVTVAKQFENNK